MGRTKELTMTEAGRMGGYAAAKAWTKAERVKLARHAANSRWAKRTKRERVA